MPADEVPITEDLKIRTVFDKPFYLPQDTVTGKLFVEWVQGKRPDDSATIDKLRFWLLNPYALQTLTHTYQVIHNSRSTTSIVYRHPNSEADCRTVEFFVIPFQDDGSNCLCVPFSFQLPDGMATTSVGAILHTAESPIETNGDPTLYGFFHLMNTYSLMATAHATIHGNVVQCASSVPLVLCAPGNTTPVTENVPSAPSCCSESTGNFGQVTIKTDRSWYEPGTIVTGTIRIQNTSSDNIPETTLGLRCLYCMGYAPSADEALTSFPWALWGESKVFESVSAGSTVERSFEFKLPADAVPTYKAHREARYEIVLQFHGGRCVDTEQIIALPVIVRPCTFSQQEWETVKMNACVPFSVSDIAQNGKYKSATETLVDYVRKRVDGDLQ